MAKCCEDKKTKEKINVCNKPTCGSESPGEGSSSESFINWWQEMVPHALEYATEEKEKGRKIVGIMCEYTPRELIMAANAIPVCLCGGSVDMIPPAEEFLPPNLCPLIKSTYGYHAKKSNPFLEMADLVVAETTCDGKKKMYELMGRTRPMYVLELPQSRMIPTHSSTGRASCTSSRKSSISDSTSRSRTAGCARRFAS